MSSCGNIEISPNNSLLDWYDLSDEIVSVYQSHWGCARIFTMFRMVRANGLGGRTFSSLCCGHAFRWHSFEQKRTFKMSIALNTQKLLRGSLLPIFTAYFSNRRDTYEIIARWYGISTIRMAFEEYHFPFLSLPGRNHYSDSTKIHRHPPYSCQVLSLSGAGSSCIINPSCTMKINKSL